MAAVLIERPETIEPVLLVGDEIPTGIGRPGIRHQELGAARITLVEFHQQSAIMRTAARRVDADRTARTACRRIQNLRARAGGNDRAAHTVPEIVVHVRHEGVHELAEDEIAADHEVAGDLALQAGVEMLRVRHREVGWNHFDALLEYIDIAHRKVGGGRTDDLL